jgi:hypothetical protein
VKLGCSVAVCLAVALAASSAAAQPLGPDGAPIVTNAYAVDLTQGPVLSSVRVTGLAGAYVAIAEGVDGNAHNPAAPAVRTPYSFSNFDYDLGLGVTVPSSIEGSDFFNSGTRTDLPRSEQSGFVFLDLAANLQFGPWGAGLSTGLQQYSLDRSVDPTVVQEDRLSAQFGVGHLIAAHAFDDHQLVLGAGVRTTALSVVNENAPAGEQNALFSMTAAGVEVGALWRPNEQPFRVGAAFRSGVTPNARTATNVRVFYQGTDDLYVPDDVSLPWDANVGVAVQFGPRPFNPRWHDPDALVARVRRFLEWRARERQRTRRQLIARAQAKGSDAEKAAAAADAELELEAALDQLHRQRAEQNVRDRLRLRYARMSRFYVLVSSALLITGEADDAVGIEGFLNRTVMRSGQRITLSPRLGVETEAVPRWVKFRAGSYIEPTRFSPAINDNRWRIHGTLGLDLKLFEWSVLGLFEEGTEWRVSGALDVSARYLGWGLSIGIWH